MNSLKLERRTYLLAAHIGGSVHARITAALVILENRLSGHPMEWLAALYLATTALTRHNRGATSSKSRGRRQVRRGR